MFVRSPGKSRVTLFITTARADITGVSQHLPPVCPQFVQSPVSPRSHPVIPVTISDPGSFFLCVGRENAVCGWTQLESQSDWLSPPCVVSVTWWEEKTPDGGWQEQHVNPPLPSTPPRPAKFSHFCFRSRTSSSFALFQIFTSELSCSSHPKGGPLDDRVVAFPGLLIGKHPHTLVNVIWMKTLKVE